MRFIDLTGQRFEKLLVMKEHGVNTKRKRVTWECLCDCGNKCIVVGADLRNGNTHSCGCMSSRKTVGDRNRTHGMSKTPLYAVWCAMKERCSNPYNKSYKDYGARGITVCDKWLAFEGFYADMGDSYEKGLTIERADNGKGYSPDNCTWIPRYQQGSNTRKNVYYTYNGETLPLMTLCNKNNFNYTLIKGRLIDGWTIEKAIETPCREHKQYKNHKQKG